MRQLLVSIATVHIGRVRGENLSLYFMNVWGCFFTYTGRWGLSESHPLDLPFCALTYAHTSAFCDVEVLDEPGLISVWADLDPTSGNNKNLVHLLYTFTIFLSICSVVSIYKYLIDIKIVHYGELERLALAEKIWQIFHGYNLKTLQT